MASPHITLIIQSYLTRADSNIIIVDWTQLSNSNYMLEIVPNVYKVSFLKLRQDKTYHYCF